MTSRFCTISLGLVLSLSAQSISTAASDDGVPVDSPDTAGITVEVSPVQEVRFVSPDSLRREGLYKQIARTRSLGEYSAKTREIEDMPPYLMAKPVMEPNTAHLADLFVPSRYLAVWFKLKLDKKGKQRRAIVFYDRSEIKEFEDYAKAVVETLTFQPPDPRAKKQDWHYYRYGYGEPLIKPYVPDTAWENLLARYEPVFRMWNGRERDMINNPWKPGDTDFQSPASRVTCPLKLIPDSVFASFEGSTFYELLIDTNGTIIGMRILESSGLPEFDQAVIEAARCNEFTPGVSRGRKVNATVIERRSFSGWKADKVSGIATQPLR